MLVTGLAFIADGHEVDDLTDPVRGHEPGHQDGGVGEVELRDVGVGAVCGDAEVAAALAVKRAGEDAGLSKRG
jgi:hypothetical protein